MKRVLLTLLFLVLPVLLVVWQVCFANTTSWYLVAAVLLLLSALPFFCTWSGSRSLPERWRCCPS